eukprot:3429315-Pleurochrysis_carterae.AAC.1
MPLQQALRRERCHGQDRVEAQFNNRHVLHGRQGRSGGLPVVREARGCLPFSCVWIYQGSGKARGRG